MTNPTAFRLDTVDVAIEFGWHHTRTSNTDEFTREGVAIKVQYSSENHVAAIARYRPNREEEFFPQDAAGKNDVLRAWLMGRASVADNPAVRPKGYAGGYRPQQRKLSWSREKWLHWPTQEVVDGSDERTPRTVDQMKKQSKTWHLALSQATIEQGYYRREMDMNTAMDTQPTIVGTWHPNNGPVVQVARGRGIAVYKACVEHFQDNFRDLPG